MRTYLYEGYGRITLPDKILNEIGVGSYDGVKIYTEDDKIIIEKYTKEKRYEDWINNMYNEFQENPSVFMAAHRNIENGKIIDIMIDLDFERMEIKERDYHNSKAKTALQYALLKHYIIPNGIEEYIENK